MEMCNLTENALFVYSQIRTMSESTDVTGIEIRPELHKVHFNNEIVYA